jgi:transcription initiation factor TFIIIB Brf1 subunit/transcription initiation factor TFIIB
MAEAAGITEVTIRNRIKELKTQLERELSNPI